MADSENVAGVIEISSFLLIVIEEGNDLLHQNSTTDEFKDKATTYLELMEAFYEVSEEEDVKICWANLTSQYRLIFSCGKLE